MKKYLNIVDMTIQTEKDMQELYEAYVKNGITDNYEAVNTRYGSAQAVQRVQATYRFQGKGGCDLVHEAEQTLAMGELRRETDRTLSYLS